MLKRTGTKLVAFELVLVIAMLCCSYFLDDYREMQAEKRKQEILTEVHTMRFYAAISSRGGSGVVAREIPTEIEIEDGLLNYSQEDVHMLGDIMYAEVGVFLTTIPDQAERAHKLVGSVVLHRLEDGRWGDTIRDVVFTPNAYPNTSKRIGKINTPDVVYEWAADLLRDGPLGPYNLIFQNTVPQGIGIYEVIGNEYFCLGNV